MAIKSIPVATEAVQADTNANANTVVLRDAAGGISVAALAATAVATSGSFSGNVVAKSASFTAAAATHYVCDATSGAITVTMPLASAVPGQAYVFIKKDSSGNAITFTGVSGVGSISSQWAKAIVFSDGTNWYSV